MSKSFALRQAFLFVEQNITQICITNYNPKVLIPYRCRRDTSRRHAGRGWRVRLACEREGHRCEPERHRIQRSRTAYNANLKFERVGDSIKEISHQNFH